MKQNSHKSQFVIILSAENSAPLKITANEVLQYPHISTTPWIPNAEKKNSKKTTQIAFVRIGSIPPPLHQPIQP